MVLVPCHQDGHAFHLYLNNGAPFSNKGKDLQKQVEFLVALAAAPVAAM